MRPLNSLLECWGKLAKARHLSSAHLPFNQYRNSEEETDRPAQDQRYEQIAKRLRSNGEPRQIGHEKAKKTKGKSSHPSRVSRCKYHDPPAIPISQNCNPPHDKKTGYA